MLLREVDLDLPLAERELRMRFRYETRCMTALFERCIPRLDIGGWKIMVECVETITKPKMRNLLGVLTIQVIFDLESFLNSRKEEKKKIAVEVLSRGIIRLADEQGWSIDPFRIALEKVKKLNYRNEWTWPKPKWSKDRKHQAILHCEHEVEYFRSWLTVKDKVGTEVLRLLGFEEKPDEFLFVPMLGKLVWESNQTVVLYDRSGKQVQKVTLTTE